MKKSDLKTGMLAETRNGNVYLVINEYLIRDEGYMKLDAFNDGLLHEDMGEFDIMKVSTIMKNANLMPKFCNSLRLNDELIWEREEQDPILTLDGVEYSEDTLRSIIKKATS